MEKNLYTIYIIAGAATVVIIGLIVVNVLLIRWVCKRNKDADTRMSVLASNVRCTAANGLPRKSRRSDVKYVTTDVTKHKQGPKKQYVNTDEAEKPKVVDARKFGDVNVTVTDYGYGEFDTLNRDLRPSNSNEALNDYGQVRLGNGSGEYDTAFFRNQKEESITDSVYAFVDKSKKKKALKTPEDSEYGHISPRNAADDKAKSLPRRGYREQESGTKEVEDTGYEVSYFGNDTEQSNNKNKKPKQGSAKTKPSKSEIKQGTKSGKAPGVKDTKDIQTENSFLQKQQPPQANGTLERKSACTQVEDMDFTLSVV